MLKLEIGIQSLFSTTHERVTESLFIETNVKIGAAGVTALTNPL